MAIWCSSWTLCRKKGVEELIDAFAEVLQDRPGLRLALAGRDTTDSRTGASYQQGLQRRMDPSVAARVEFLAPAQ
jgi:hypothetical protein